MPGLSWRDLDMLGGTSGLYPWECVHMKYLRQESFAGRRELSRRATGFCSWGMARASNARQPTGALVVTSRMPSTKPGSLDGWKAVPELNNPR